MDKEKEKKRERERWKMKTENPPKRRGNLGSMINLDPFTKVDIWSSQIDCGTKRLHPEKEKGNAFTYGE